jgi:hypothetical protein
MRLKQPLHLANEVYGGSRMTMKNRYAKLFRLAREQTITWVDNCNIHYHVLRTARLKEIDKPPLHSTRTKHRSHLQNVAWSV